MVDNGQTLCLSAASSCIVESEREPLLTTRANLRDPSAVVYSTLSVSFPPPMESCFLPGTREGGQKKKKKKKSVYVHNGGEEEDGAMLAPELTLASGALSLSLPLSLFWKAQLNHTLTRPRKAKNTVVGGKSPPQCPSFAYVAIHVRPSLLLLLFFGYPILSYKSKKKRRRFRNPHRVLS